MASAQQAGTIENQGDKRLARRRAILDAAEQLFMEHGFSKVSLGAIVARSGGSLATVYEMFQNKEGLLRAVVERHEEEELGDWLSDVSDDDPPSVSLRRIAARGYSFLTSERFIAMTRIVIGHSLEDPSFGRDFRRLENEAFIATMAGLFREWTLAGKAKIDDPEAAVNLFIAIVACDVQISSLMGTAPSERHCGALDWRLEAFLRYFEIS